GGPATAMSQTPAPGLSRVEVPDRRTAPLLESPTMRGTLGTGPRLAILAGAVVVAVALPGCGGSTGKGSGSSPNGPLTLQQVKSNLEKAGYRIKVYSRDEGVLYLDRTHKADGGLSIDYGPSGQQLYASV